MRRTLLVRQAGAVFLAAAWSLAPGAIMAAPQAADPVPAASPSASPVKHHPCNADVKNELTTVIDAQLAAFRANDYAKAYTFAATEIKSLFAPADFEGMVRKGYPAIAQSTDVDYGMAFDTGEEAVIYVRVQNTATKANGQYQYLLKKENGAWKIGGVSELKGEGLSV